MLTSLGFTVVMEPFEFSSAPGRWATPAAGVLSILAIAAAGHVGSRGDARAALAILLVMLLVGAPTALWVARHGILSLPLARRTAVNLVATRPSGSPSVWLVAHLDSKSQPVPTAVRALGIVLSVAVWVIALTVAVLQWRGGDVASFWVPVTLAGVVAGLPVAASVVGDQSPGALDNASGVATVLSAAEQVAGANIGVLLTSAEELGLAGARAWAAGRQPGVALNCDGVDDAGSVVCMRSSRARGEASVTALVEGAAHAGVPLVVRGLVPGLLVDAVALADAGWDVATVSRGTWATLARVHRPGDDLAHLSGAGIDEAARVMAAAARLLTASKHQP